MSLTYTPSILSDDGPSLCFHSVVNFAQTLYIYGGIDERSAVIHQFHTFHIKTLKWDIIEVPKDENYPGPRCGHTAITFNQEMFLFGGKYHVDLLADLWAFYFDKKTWRRVTVNNTLLTGRAFHASAAFNGKWYILGGITKMKGKDFFELDFTSGEVVAIESTNQPPGLFGHSLVATHDSLIFFGGEKSKQQYHSLYICDMKQMVWTEIETMGDAPSPRSKFFSYFLDDSVFVVGGYCGSGKYGEGYLYQFHVENNTWSKHALNKELRLIGQGFAGLVREGTIFIVGGHKGANLIGLAQNSREVLFLKKDL